MNLDDKLKELGNEVPQANPSLEKKIYMKSTRNKTSRNPFFNKLTLSLGGFVLTALALIIGIVSFNQLETHRMNTSVHLLQKVNEPTKINDSLGYSAQFLDKLNQFSSQLAYYTVEEQGQSENTVMSPVSIFSALALATECSDGSSREQILKAMGMDYDILSLNYEILYRQINRTGLNDDSSIEISKLSNTIWMDKNITFKDSCLQNLANHYYSYSHGIDLKQKKYASRYITDFISKKTDGFLKPEYHVSNETVFLLINTYYLKDVWQNTGKEIRLTDSKYDFINSNGTKVNTKLMMGKYRAGKAQETEEYSEFYTSTSHGYKVHFIVPKDG
ncbi:MAG: hypothetical protein K2H06_04345, partial [Anaeroplasmataceae bacterium]|nr:hypothetical protein [Anaeroplasmataceae bacterium]